MVCLAPCSSAPFKSGRPVLVLMRGNGLRSPTTSTGQNQYSPYSFFLYLLGYLSAALAPLCSVAFLQRRICPVAPRYRAAVRIVEVLRLRLMSMVSNPIDALLNALTISGILVRRRSGICPRHGNETTKTS
ncbi:hypothetical protein KCP70_07625 [Salmonella enterica subsp. enterica]|nr:hypothetical protein KCP70_07625 [Salmonella enterica subsp. enterica]